MTLAGYFAMVAIMALSSQTVEDLVIASEDANQLTSADYFDPEEYQVGPGDNLWISFPGGIPFSTSGNSETMVIIPVGLDGILRVPGMAPIDVRGKSLADVRDMIIGSIQRSYGRLAVSTGLSRSASFEIPVTGQVASPGIVTVNGLNRLSEALERAGGPTATASFSNVAVVTMEGDSTFYDLNEFTSNGIMGSNPLMLRTTRVHVFAAEQSIVVEGAVNQGTVGQSQLLSEEQFEMESKRAVIEYIAGETPGDAVRRVGGPTSGADLDHVFVYREDRSGNPFILEFDLQREDSSFTLLPGDRVVVPFIDRYVNVVGQVMNPMAIPYSPGMTLSYYIGMAGGFTQAARRGSLKFVLRDGSREDAELEDIVPPGTSVEVPRVPILFWQEYLAILTGVATVIISYQSISQ